MKKYLLLTLLLTGCAHQFELYSRNGGANGAGTAQEAGKQVTINLDGEMYKGTYTFNGGDTIITTTNGTATAYSDNRSATAYATGISTSYVPGSGQGRIFARTQSGKALRCEFSYNEDSGLGICEDNDHNQYDLVIKN